MVDNPQSIPLNPTDSPRQNKPIGCILLGLFPFILVASVFIAGYLEESGNRIAGWLWIPFSIFVMLAFAIINYHLSAGLQKAERSQESDAGAGAAADESMPSSAGNPVPLNDSPFEWETSDQKSKSAREPKPLVSDRCTNYILRYIALQLLVLIVIGFVAYLLALMFNPFAGMGANW